MTPRRVAAVDCGTNTLRLLIADIDPTAVAPVSAVEREIRTVRLGEGVDRTGIFSPAALQRARTALEDYADVIAANRVDAVRVVATSATREAANRQDFIDSVRSALGVGVDVISGEEEAKLTFAGVHSGLAVTGRSLVFDIGGGSTELVIGSSSGIEAAISTDIGVVRLSERHVHHDPPWESEIAAVRADVRRTLAGPLTVLGRLDDVAVIGVAGTVTTAAALASGAGDYDPALVHAQQVCTIDLTTVARWAYGTTTQERAQHPAMHPGRAAVFPAGMVILTEILAAVDADAVTVSASDILDGVAMSIGQV